MAASKRCKGRATDLKGTVKVAADEAEAERVLRLHRHYPAWRATRMSQNFAQLSAFPVFARPAIMTLGFY